MDQTRSNNCRFNLNRGLGLFLVRISSDLGSTFKLI